MGGKNQFCRFNFPTNFLLVVHCSMIQIAMCEFISLDYFTDVLASTRLAFSDFLGNVGKRP